MGSRVRPRPGEDDPRSDRYPGSPACARASLSPRTSPGEPMNLLTWIALSLAAAQEASSQDRLKKAVEEARTELAAEQARFAKEDAAADAEISRAKELVAKSTDELVDRTGTVSRKTKELENLRADRGKLRQARSGAVLIWADLHRSALDMRQKLSDLLEALPPSESRASQAKLLEEAKTALDHPAGEPFQVLHLPLDVTQRLVAERRESGPSTTEVLKSGGPVMIPLLGVALLAVLVSLERALTLMAKSAGSGREDAAVLGLCKKGDFQEAA